MTGDSSVPPLVTWSHSGYSPARMFSVSPGSSESSPFWIVCHGSASIPGLASEPSGATYLWFPVEGGNRDGSMAPRVGGGGGGGAGTTEEETETAVAEPATLLATTVRRNENPTSAAATGYDAAVAPPMSLQAAPLQRCHRYAYAIGAVPDHDPGPPVSDDPTSATPENEGAAVFPGGSGGLGRSATS